MNAILSQFRRIYSDNGSGDKDFTKLEARLKKSRDNLIDATEELVKASENLNDAAMKAYH